jgi:hypothetical protein
MPFQGFFFGPRGPWQENQDLFFMAVLLGNRKNRKKEKGKKEKL